MISGSGWAWARGGDSLSCRRGRGQCRELVSSFTLVLLFEDIVYGSKVVILEEDTDVEVGIGV